MRSVLNFLSFPLTYCREMRVTSLHRYYEEISILITHDM
jgi:hypothetical protein